MSGFSKPDIFYSYRVKRRESGGIFIPHPADKPSEKIIRFGQLHIPAFAGQRFEKMVHTYFPAAILNPPHEPVRPKAGPFVRLPNTMTYAHSSSHAEIRGCFRGFMRSETQTSATWPWW